MSMVDVAQLVESRIVIPAVAGSNPVVHPIFRMGPLAQLVEQETLNLLVEGSTPSRPTKFTLNTSIYPSHDARCFSLCEIRCRFGALINSLLRAARWRCNGISATYQEPGPPLNNGRAADGPVALSGIQLDRPIEFAHISNGVVATTERRPTIGKPGTLVRIVMSCRAHCRVSTRGI